MLLLGSLILGLGKVTLARVIFDHYGIMCKHAVNTYWCERKKRGTKRLSNEPILGHHFAGPRVKQSVLQLTRELSKLANGMQKSKDSGEIPPISSDRGKAELLQKQAERVRSEGMRLYSCTPFSKLWFCLFHLSSVVETQDLTGSCQRQCMLERMSNKCKGVAKGFPSTTRQAWQKQCENVSTKSPSLTTKKRRQQCMLRLRFPAICFD